MRFKHVTLPKHLQGVSHVSVSCYSFPEEVGTAVLGVPGPGDPSYTPNNQLPRSTESVKATEMVGKGCGITAVASYLTANPASVSGHLFIQVCVFIQSVLVPLHWSSFYKKI